MACAVLALASTFFAVAQGSGDEHPAMAAFRERQLRLMATPLPDLVATAVSTRRPTRTSIIEYVHEERAGDDAHRRHYVTQTSGGTVWEANLGDDDGKHPDDYRRALAWVAKSRFQTIDMFDFQYQEPKNKLRIDDRVWYKEGTSLIVDVRSAHHLRGMLPNNIGALGAGPMFFSRDIHNPLGIPDHLADDGWESVTFASTDVGAQQRVTGELNVGASVYRLEWDLDPAQGGQPVRSALYRDGAMLYQSVTQLQRVGKRWFPKATEFFRSDYQNGKAAYAVVSVDSASFDEPWHWQDPFTPSDIGVELGHPLTVEPWVGGDGRVMYWDGLDIINEDEYIELVHIRGIDPGPTVVARQAKFGKTTPEAYLKRIRKSSPIFRKRREAKFGRYESIAPKKNDKEDDWDAFVREFVVRHDLSGKRKDAAYRLLKHAKGLRDFHKHKYKKAVEQAKAAGELKKASKLEEPVERIFKFLKRGLLRLIPRSERKRK